MEECAWRSVHGGGCMEECAGGGRMEECAGGGRMEECVSVEGERWAHTQNYLQYFVSPYNLMRRRLRL